MTGEQQGPGFRLGGLPGIPRRGWEGPVGVVWTPEQLAELRRALEAFQECGGWMAKPEMPPGHHGNVHGDPGGPPPYRGVSADLVIWDDVPGPEGGGR